MELCTSLRRIVGRNRLYRKVIGYLYLVTVHHHFARAVHVSTALIGNESRLGACQRLDGLLVEVVAVLVGYKQIVGLWHGGIVYHLIAQLRHGINLNLLSVILDADAGMNEGMEHHFLPALGLEHVGFVICLATGCRQSQSGQQAS